MCSWTVMTEERIKLIEVQIRVRKEIVGYLENSFLDKP